MIFFGTPGGILMFGIAGIFIVPLIASFVHHDLGSVRLTFNDYLPEVYYRKQPVEPVDSGDEEESGH